MKSADLQPLLQGELLTLRPLRSDDFEALHQAASDLLIWEQHPQSDRYKREVFQKFFDGAIESRGAFAILDREAGVIIGSSRYYNLDSEKRTMTIGYTFLRREYWGGKFNRELKSLMLRHAFQFVDAVTFEIGKNNLRSRKAIERIGAKLIEQASLDGQSHVIYRISRADFERA